ncbi:hypothetical protein EDD86DRAFT_189111 [Gorgonomyces haynaldii]|nr:hypothetical protein EDD86DRAFT_189111 [Gorgonomyces haynaldii]
MLSEQHSNELMLYYRQRLDKAEEEYQEALNQIDKLKISHEESHKLSWELHKRSQEVVELQQALQDFQQAVFEERKQTLRIVAENDELKIQELKDRKKIRFLLSLSGAPEEEVTYFRDRLDKRLVKISRTIGPDSQLKDPEERKLLEERDLLILEDEVQGLKLQVSSLETQLSEQKEAYDAIIAGLQKEKRIRLEEEKIRRDHDHQKVESLMERLDKSRALCRENTRVELLRAKKAFHNHERRLLEEKTHLIEQLSGTRKQLHAEQHRNETVEKAIEVKVNKSQEKLINDLRSHNSKLEEEMRNLKMHIEELEQGHNRRLDHMKTRLEQAQNNYNSIKRRRDYEIEGFTNDILALRKQLRTLEKSILKYGSLEDKELVLLNLARLTGERAGKISSELQALKSKVYATEQEVQSLPF